MMCGIKTTKCSVKVKDHYRIHCIVYKGAEETFLVSADVYCQNQNNPFRLHINDL
jgi:hypothetical protein